MCNASLRGIMWRAASAAVGVMGLAVCLHIAPAPYPDASANNDASSLVLTIVERSVPDAVACVFHKSGGDNRPRGFFACAKWTLHAARELAGDNGDGRQVADAPFDSHAR